ncbi:interaptin [Cryptosporidium sp. chipmunk genotype I]|uniref:interaptin n=1 Tax=Cryptosporidium sp. chipmunk genotype I TaxID=1280935 RepID=UPI00351A1D06|nr:interaptin [Cryptosporidium sp. chipmunk genotype I]
MQSIIKNAFDKVSVIKDVVGNSIEEAVKNNTRDSSYVFNSGSSISTSIVNWAEKNNVSERANNIKVSASMFVGDLATGLKGMTNNITVQNNFTLEKSNQHNKLFQEKNEYDYFSGEFDSIDNIDKFYDDNDCSSQTICNSENTFEEMSFTEYKFANETRNPQDIKIRNLNLSSNSDETCAKFGGLDTKPNSSNFSKLIDNPIENKKIIRDCPKSISECNLLDLHKSSSNSLEDDSMCSNSERKIDHEKKIISSNIQSEIFENSIEILNSERELIENTKNQRQNCDLKNVSNLNNSNSSSIEFQETPREVNSDTRNNLIGKFEENLKDENYPQLNPLTFFQKISKLEEQNKSLENELEQVKNESTELKEKINTKTKIINSINSRLSKLEIEKKSLRNCISELENSKAEYKLKIDELEHLNLNLKLNEDANKEQTNMIRSLQERIVELENTLAIGEVNKIESLKTYQNEISELRLKLSNLKEKEGNNYKPYINRISTLEYQLSELRRRHSNELQRFEIIIDNLKKKSVKDSAEKETLENKLKEANKAREETIVKYDVQIAQYKYIVDQIENNKLSNAHDTKRLTDANKSFKLSICNVNELIIVDKHVDNGKISLNQDTLPYLNHSVLSKPNSKTQLSMLNPLQEEIKQALHDKKLLEDEYFTVYEKNKQIGQELVEEKQRNRLLQQQLESMFKLVNDLSVKLDESKKS